MGFLLSGSGGGWGALKPPPKFLWGLGTVNYIIGDLDVDDDFIAIGLDDWYAGEGKTGKAKLQPRQTSPTHPPDYKK